MSDDKKYMGIALSEAQKAAELGEIPIGAVLVLDGEIIAKAHNMRETWKDATAHAEMIVIREACEKLDRWRLSGATLYVTIEPCPMCAGAIVMSRITRLVYGSPDSKAGAAESLFNVVNNPALNHTVDVVSGVCAEECTKAMKDFFKKRRNEAKQNNRI
ncbi:MAG: tRNA adenosine(34) deaminase TadA [Acidaminococcaceae bacterium]